MSGPPRVIGAERVATAAGPEGFPREGLPEIAFLGRSNVGKSSLLNRLVSRKQLARTSGTPGKTRLLHFFEVRRRGPHGDTSLLFVDLPGYGFARVSRAERAAWRPLVEGYLADRPPLRLAILLQDLRRDVSDDELDLLAWLEARGVAALVALTKCDKLKPMRRAGRLREHAGAFGLPPERLLATSAESGLGLGALWGAIDAALEGPATGA